MNELIYNFFNEIEDVNKVKEMTVEEFTKLVKSNKLISDDDATQLIESFKKISSKKNSEDETSDADQRKKKYKLQQKEVDIKSNDIKTNTLNEKEIEEDSIER